MRKSIIFFSVVTTLLISCSDADTKSEFSISGVIENNTAKKVYLEEVPASTMQPTLVDSAEIDKNGKFVVGTDPKESVVFNLRLDQNMYPVVSLVNDVSEIDIRIRMNKENNQFPESYDVKGSPASQLLKDFVITFNSELQKMYVLVSRLDSLNNSGAADSLVLPLEAEQKVLAGKIKQFSEDAFTKAVDPALLMFELGYYQSTANAPRFGLEALTTEHVTAIITQSAQKFPGHKAIASVKAGLEEQQQKAMAASWIGKEAPDFALPDVNGREVKLSSFRGKYVLIDFWASWCGPCRAENPNLVQAYNQFKEKNFTVLGVSLDRPGQKDKWLKAIKDDQLTWTHVSDLQFWNSPVVPLYKFEGIPFNVLVNPEGKIIAEGLRGPGLETKLAEVLN